MPFIHSPKNVQSSHGFLIYSNSLAHIASGPMRSKPWYAKTETRSNNKKTQVVKVHNLSDLDNYLKKGGRPVRKDVKNCTLPDNQPMVHSWFGEQNSQWKNVWS